MMNSQYKPVSDNIHEKLEILVLERKKCEIIFLKDGARVVIKDRIEVLYHRDNMEFLRVFSGLEIRLDQLIQVDGTTIFPLC